MLVSWFKSRNAQPASPSYLPDAVRNEVLSMCRADAMALRLVGGAERPDCGCLGADMPPRADRYG